MSVYIISDLHIWGPEDPIYESLIAMIRDKIRPGDRFIMAGDIFDLFVGNKKVYLERYSKLIESLEAALNRGVSIYYIEGNHDFLLQQAFKTSGLKVCPHEITFEIQGKKFFIAHGDTVDKADYGYRFLRSFFRSPLMKFLVWAIPGEWLDQIGRASSNKSRSKKPALLSHLPIEKREYLRRVYRNYAAEKLAQGFDFVVMGHCHDLDEMCFQIGGRPGQYVNVGYPRMHGSYLSWVPGDEKIQRERLPDPE